MNGLPDGSTCTLGLILNGKLTVANVGDSVATLVKTDGTVSQLSIDHLASKPDEAERIKQANGIVFRDRVNGSINLSRSFGDQPLKEMIIAEPDGLTLQLTDRDDLLILASDGIYRSYTQEYVAERAQQLRKQNMSLGKIAQTIVEEALQLVGTNKPCSDNVTLIIVSLQDYLTEYHTKFSKQILCEDLLIRK